MRPITLLVLANPAARYLAALERLPDSTHIVVGDTKEAFLGKVAGAEVIFTGMGFAPLLRELWPDAARVRWVHSFSAGLDNVLFPELIESTAVMTNARGVFARSLGEFVIASVLFFAKELRRMIWQQREGVWEPFDVEEVHGQTMGIVGYGEIGRAAAERAHALGMKTIALRRRPELSSDDPLVDRTVGPDGLFDLLREADYVVVSAALTPSTRGMIGEAELNAMKRSAVLINVGRGPVVVESALVRALRENRIKGAALDVFDEEPLPVGHPFYDLENVLLSPHSADHTATWLDEAMQLFVENFERFVKGEPLHNVVDKSEGY
ncbi:MAG TPA: D-2-hydroxyacid dehydrogenase [Bryobacteraceae bacterium]|nr:D-2-hydroxyacid dehydrogenase [Bryobacteraceae bacterium]